MFHGDLRASSDTSPYLISQTSTGHPGTNARTGGEPDWTSADSKGGQLDSANKKMTELLAVATTTSITLKVVSSNYMHKYEPFG